METISKKSNESPQDNGLVDVPSHKVAGGIGALAGGVAAGAAVGTVAGPVGTAIGAVVGAVAGGLGADAVGNAIDELREEAHWREHYRSRPYVAADAPYDDYAPAYKFGVASFIRYRGRDFEDVASDLSGEWQLAREQSALEWDDARHATRDAWDRLAASRTREVDR